ncbi:MAG: DNA polymerase III subunit alpha [Deltaproteobacteria bacterium]|nr:MAG: DNA polymerase III subunit alpha [Deltaproteobacteria bacterium]
MPHANFVHLHLHTQYSLLDGAIKIDDLMGRSKEYRLPALAVTDHGNMFGAIKFYQAAHKHGIRPILGCELYLAPRSRFEKSGKGGFESSYHLTLLAMNSRGYQNLLKLVTAGYLEGFYYRPRVDQELIEKFNEGLIALSGCIHGEVPHLLSIGDHKTALEVARKYQNVFDNERFYLEVQENKVPEQEKVNHGLVELGRELSLPLVATNDCHYLNKEDAGAHDALLCIQTGKKLGDTDRMKFSTDELYFKSPREMGELFHWCPEAIENTLKIAHMCNFELELGGRHFPIFSVPEDTTRENFLRSSSLAGLGKRLAAIGDSDGSGDIYHQRLEEELKVIEKVGLSDYFLIVADLINYARSQNIPVGPGRGSAAGSLVAYALNITDINPITYDLLFERFLNPERVSMPDIDMDFCMEARDRVIQYVIEKYGKDKVAHITTFGTMMAKAVIRDVGRVLDLPYADVDRIAKLVPNVIGITIEESLAREPELQKLEKEDERVKKVLSIARSLEGLNRHASTHASGVVISNKPLEEYSPLYQDNKGNLVTQYDMHSLESIGLIKFDFLGLKTLTLIEKAKDLIKQNRGIEVNFEQIDLEDPPTYQLLGEGKTTGVFQLESAGMRDLVIRLRPECFEELIALIALYRPGPLKSGMVDEFIARKQGKKSIRYELEGLEEILRDTFGIILYQEQVMQISRKLASFSPEDADILRRAMAKKLPDEMNQQREKFLKGAKSNKIAQRKAEKVFDLMAEFAGYGFNKSHSAAYAMVAFQTAYLSSHYPLEFMAALLTSEIGDSDKIIKYISQCREQGIEVLPPDVNESDRDFTVVEDKIRFGLAAVKNVGSGAIEAILSARHQDDNFISLTDFCQRVDLRKVNKKVVESLIKCGAFDFCGAYRSQLASYSEKAMESGARMQKDKSQGQLNIFETPGYEGPEQNRDELPPMEEWPRIQLLTYEKEALGFYITDHPLTHYSDELKKYTDTDTSKLTNLSTGCEVCLGGIVTSIKEINDRKGERMAFITLEDLTGSVEITVFHSLFDQTSQSLRGQAPILLKGKLEKTEDNNAKILATEISPLSQGKEIFTKGVHLTLAIPELSKDKLNKLSEILRLNKGNCRGYLHLIVPDKSETIISLPDDFKLSPSDLLVERVQELLGADTIYLQ